MFLLAGSEAGLRVLKRFSTFSLDTANQCVWRAEHRIQLTPKAYTVLSYLIEHSGRIVTKEELLEAAWADTFVQEAVLKTCVLDIRKALGDNPKDPKYIVTVHRRGYRFIGNPADTPQTATLLGRAADLKRLHSLLNRLGRGDRQIAFVTGEPGIGKSTLVAHFLNEAAQAGPVRILKGQCFEHFGPREAYYPVFEALARAAKDTSIPGFLDILRTYAPTWMVEMPGVGSPVDREALKQETLGATRERMLREMTEAIEVLATQDPVIFVLEDLHWSDLSTLDLISWIANRSGNARILLIATYRPVEAILNNHPVKPLKQGLFAQGRCVELELSLLSRSDIAEFLTARFPNHDFPSDFANLVHARTDGNALFINNVLDYAASRSLITNQDGTWRLTSALSDFDLGVPESLSQMIETQLGRLAPREHAVLEMASVVGTAFAAPLLADDDPQEGSPEACCEGMATRNLFIRSTGLAEFGAGHIGARYQFTHALYREVLYRRLSPLRRIRLHRSIGERLETVFEGRLNEVASELALHFQEGRDPARAIRYLCLVVQKCAARHALREALEAVTRALGLAAALPEPDKSATEFELIEQLGLLQRLMGQLTPAAAEFEKMFELVRKAGNVEGQLRALLQLASVTSWLDRTRCLRAVDTIVALCDSPLPSELRVKTLGEVAYWNLLFRSWDERDALASAAALDVARQSGDRVSVALHANRQAFFQCLSSQYRNACATAEEGVRTAIEIESLLDYSVGHFFEAWALLHLGEWGRLQRLTRSAIDMANKNGHDLWVVLFGFLETFLHLQAFSFDHARQACREHLGRARTLRHELSVQIGLVLLGMAELGAGNLAGASESFGEIREWQGRQRILMDWIWRMPLQFGFIELCLAQGDVKTARVESELFLSATSVTAERTWIALAHYARACVAVALQDDATVQHEVSRGLEAIEGREAPLAAWRLHALAARTYGGEPHAMQARTVVRGLADSLSGEDLLQRSFLSSPPVAAILGQRRAADRPS